MKRLIAVLLALVLIVMPVSAQTGSFFDYTDDILENGDLIYYFQELSLTLPASWRGKVMAEQDESGVSFYQISSHENYLKEGIKNGGFLFELGASVNHDFSKLPSFRYIGFCEESAMNYYLRLPTDYPAYNEEAMLIRIKKMTARTRPLPQARMKKMLQRESHPDSPVRMRFQRTRKRRKRTTARIPPGHLSRSATHLSTA